MLPQRTRPMIELNLDPELEKALAAAAARTGEAPADLARKALLAYLEDLEDYALAVEASRDLDRKDTVSLHEMMTRYNVEG
ncbi:CopG family transcriptional regulator [Sphingomonas sp. ST-64]|uniref:CopG family transcriptional regulator n=1 Tax=Sphingomonas plantiphila TaxID=3163295 RepID=A0ABW8YN42_9SPHN